MSNDLNCILVLSPTRPIGLLIFSPAGSLIALPCFWPNRAQPVEEQTGFIL